MNDSLSDRLISLVGGIFFFTWLLIILWFIGLEIYYEIIHVNTILNFKFWVITFFKVIATLVIFYYLLKKSFLIVMASLFKIFVIFGWIVLDKTSLFKFNYYCTEILEVDTYSGGGKGS